MRGMSPAGTAALDPPEVAVRRDADRTVGEKTAARRARTVAAQAAIPAIEVEELDIEFGPVHALRGVSFSLERGEVLGFLGPNGAGKTTTINVLSTLLRPTRGSARVLGFDVVRQAREVRRRLGLVMQRSCVDVMLTVYENLYLYAGLHRIPRRERREKIEELLELFGLEGKAQEPVQQLSGGLLRRVALARAFLADCEVLFLDEPTAGIDARGKAAFHDFLRELCRQTGLTIFVATHDLAEAERLCTRIAFIKEGRLLAIASPATLRATIEHSVLAIEFDAPVVPVQEFAAREGIGAVRWQGNRHVEIDVVQESGRALDVLNDLRRMTPVKSFELRTPSLEDVFMRLSGE